jgi:hypothetical protein
MKSDVCAPGDPDRTTAAPGTLRSASSTCVTPAARSAAPSNTVTADVVTDASRGSRSAVITTGRSCAVSGDVRPAGKVTCERATVGGAKSAAASAARTRNVE